MRGVCQIVVAASVFTAAAHPLARRFDLAPSGLKALPAVSLADSAAEDLASVAVGEPIALLPGSPDSHVLPSLPVLRSFPLNTQSVVSVELTSAQMIGLPDTDALYSLLVYRGLSDGSLENRLPQWRPVLLRMLVATPRGANFDHVLTLLLGTFPGGDDDSRIRALRRWLPGNSDAVATGDVLRALTRRYIQSGRSEEAILAAKEMAAVRADYTLRAQALQAYAWAFAGEHEKAANAIRLARELNPSSGEMARLDFLSAWLLLQEGETDAALPVLRNLANGSSGEFARRARAILESLEGEN
jgi:hypothetical protein